MKLIHFNSHNPFTSAIRNVEECALDTGWFTLWSRYATLRLSHHRYLYFQHRHAWLEHTQHITLDSAGFHFSHERSLPSFRIDSVGDLCTRYAHITCTAEAASNAFIRRWATELSHEFWTRFSHVLPFEELHVRSQKPIRRQSNLSASRPVSHLHRNSHLRNCSSNRWHSGH